MQKPVPSDISPTDTAVEFEAVSKSFFQWRRSGTAPDIIKSLFRPQKREIKALSDVGFTVNPGEFVAYAGPNGAGKSTSIKLACGMLKEDSGRVRVLGMDPFRDRIPLMRKVGILFGNRSELWFDHPVEMSFEWKKKVWDIPEDAYKKTKAMMTELLDLSPIMNTFARELSLGQRMRADLGLALLHEPSLILLDEPTLGLDVLAKRQMIGFLKALNREKNVTVLVTSHDMDDLAEMARRIILISGGKIAFDGDFTSLRGFIGGGRRLIVTTAESAAPVLPGLSLLMSEARRHVFAFDERKIPLAHVLRFLSETDGIQGISFDEASLEEGIAELYVKWREQPV